MTTRIDFQPTSIDPVKLVDNYLDGSDWRRNENSNVSFSIGGLILHEAGAVSANYWLHKIYDEDIARAHQECDMHCHDMCFDGEAEFFLANGKTMSFFDAEKNGITGARVKSFDEKTRKYIEADAVNICKRALNKEVIRVTLNDGAVLPLCEPTHEFLTKNRGYVEAQFLKDDDILVEYNEDTN
jgi:hypothetical protein